MLRDRQRKRRRALPANGEDTQQERSRIEKVDPAREHSAEGGNVSHSRSNRAHQRPLDQILGEPAGPVDLLEGPSLENRGEVVDTVRGEMLVDEEGSGEGG
jgi:hypothetical protein